MKFSEQLLGYAFMGSTMVAAAFILRKLTGHSFGINTSSFSNAIQAILFVTSIGGVFLLTDPN